MIRYMHTNIIAKDVKRLSTFYKEVFQCESINEKRDIRGDWLDHLTGLHNAHIVGEHLSLPGYDGNYPFI